MQRTSFSNQILGSASGPPLVPRPSEKPTPGNFYRIKRGDTLFGITRRAYGTRSLSLARSINDSPYNRRFRRRAPSSERKMFPGGRISFSPRFACDIRSQATARIVAPFGRCFAVVWIPRQSGA